MKKSTAPGRSTTADLTPEQLMHALFEAAHDLRTRLEEALQAAGLSSAKYMALQQLAKHGEPITLRELAAGQKCAASNITQLVDRLESDGLVRRVDDATDRRSVRAELTPLGRRQQAVGARAVANVQADFARSLSALDRKALARGLAAGR